MGTIKNDSCLDKLRATAAREVRGCVICQQTAGAPNHEPGRKDTHRYFDPADEPIFVLRAQDVTAPRILFKWIEANKENIPQEKFEEAMRCMTNMLEWPRKKVAD